MNNFKKKYLSKSEAPYFISEIGINHNGKLSLAIELIKKSKKIGCSAVKFQKRDADDLIAFHEQPQKPNGYLSKNSKDIPKESKKTKFGKWVYPDTRLELTKNDYKKIKKLCNRIKIDLIITPWDESSVDFVIKLGVKCIKIASIDANNYHFCNYIAKKKKPTIISTGMCTYDDLLITNKIFNKYKTPHMFLHCTSSYPSKNDEKHLNCIPKLKKLLKTDIGFSGHGRSFIGSAGAIALGCDVIEKHVTLNKNMSGPDHNASLDVDVFLKTIEVGNEIKKALGSDKKSFLKSEKVLNSILLRHLSVRRHIKVNSRLNIKDIKPVLTMNKKNSILPKDLFKVLGKKFKKSLKKGEILKYNHLKI